MVAGIIVAGIMVTGLTAGIIAIVKNNRPKLSMENIPPKLGVLDGVPAQPLLDKLARSLDEDFIDQVKQRYLKEHPKQSEADFEWRLFELKRYFLLVNLLKKAPMFSDEVDEIWHHMLLFTKNYQSFSERFLGRMLHHNPNINPKPEPQERAFFDWVFSQLFEINQFTWKAWGDFFKNPVDVGVLKEFKHGNEEYLKEKYFNINEDNRDLVEYLLFQMNYQLSEAEKMYQDTPKGSFTRPRHYDEISSLSMVMIFYSYFYFDDYWTYAKAYTFAEAAKYTSGCSTAIFCGYASSGRDNSEHSGGWDSGGDGGGDSGGGSSCSSCGSGCSS